MLSISPFCAESSFYVLFQFDSYSTVLSFEVFSHGGVNTVPLVKAVLGNLRVR